MSTPTLLTIVVTHRRRGRHPLRIVGLFASTAEAISQHLETLARAGATEAGRISARVLA